MPKTITVLGKRDDIEKYKNQLGYNVYSGSGIYTWSKNIEWLQRAIERGDDFLLVSTDFSGLYLKEIQYLVGIDK